MFSAEKIQNFSRHVVPTTFAALIGTDSGGTVATTFYSLDLSERNRSLSGMAQLIGGNRTA